MTVYKIETLKELVNDYRGTGQEIVTAWEYTNAMNNETMFAAFTPSCYCDIHESPAVLNPILIYRSGKWLGKYKFMEWVV